MNQQQQQQKSKIDDSYIIISRAILPLVVDVGLNRVHPQGFAFRRRGLENVLFFSISMQQDHLIRQDGHFLLLAALHAQHHTCSLVAAEREALVCLFSKISKGGVF